MNECYSYAGRGKFTDLLRTLQGPLHGQHGAHAPQHPLPPAPAPNRTDPLATLQGPGPDPLKHQDYSPQPSVPLALSLNDSSASTSKNPMDASNSKHGVTVHGVPQASLTDLLRTLQHGHHGEYGPPLPPPPHPDRDCFPPYKDLDHLLPPGVLSALEQRHTALERKTSALEKQSSALERQSSALDRQSSALEKQRSALEQQGLALEKQARLQQNTASESSSSDGSDSIDHPD
jgi:hypothetical protein